MVTGEARSLVPADDFHALGPSQTVEDISWRFIFL
jgi:hypothetical protein